MFFSWLPGVGWIFAIFVILSLVTSSISSSNDSPNICDFSTTDCNNAIFINNIYASGLGYLVLSGQSDGSNSATWVISPDLTDHESLWLLITKEGWKNGYFLQYYNTSDTSNLEIVCDSPNPLQVFEYGPYTEDFIPTNSTNGWIVSKNQKANAMYFSATCSNGVSNCLGSTSSNPYGALTFYNVAGGVVTSEPESAGGVAGTVTQGEPIKTTISSGVVTSTSTIWIYVTQPVTQTTTEASTTIFTTLGALKRRKDLSAISTFTNIIRRGETTVYLASGMTMIVIPTSTYWVPVTSTSVIEPVEMQTVEAPSMTQTVTPTPTPGGLSQSDKIAVGIGVPSAVFAHFGAFAGVWWCHR